MSPFETLCDEDFPLFASGAHVYRRTMSSPLFTAPSPAMAQELAKRINRDQFEQTRNA